MAKTSKKTKWICDLDSSGVLRGYKQVIEDMDGIDAGDREENMIGKYKWNGESFIPLPPAGSQDNLIQEPNAIEAIALGLESLALSTKTQLPKATQDWLDHYFNSIEFVVERPKK